MQIDTKLFYAITDDNVLTVGAKKPIRAKSLANVIAVALKKAGTEKKTTKSLWFGDRQPIPNETKLSRHWHIAFLRDLSDNEKNKITECIKFNCECYEWGEPEKIVRWGCMYSMSYLMNHGAPFVKVC